MRLITSRRHGAPGQIAEARPKQRGQTLVEFGLVFPMFVTLLMSVIEFAFVFNAILAVNYSARDAALNAAEAGNAVGADCVIIKAVEAAVGAPASNARIVSIEIYETNASGTPTGFPTVWTRTGGANPLPCLGVDGSSVPYTLTSNAYPEATRCNILAGCDPLDPLDSVDNVGVRVSYSHDWVTPLKNFIGGGAGTMDFDRSSVMRMEPVL